MSKKLRSEQVDLSQYYSKTEATPLIEGSNITLTETELGIVISSSGGGGGGETYTGSTSITLTGNSFQRAALTGDVTSPLNSNVTTLSNSGVIAGTYNTSTTSIQPFTVDAKGRIISVGMVATITPAWGSVTGKPSTYTPSAHTHAVSDITGLSTTLTGLEDSVDNASTLVAGTNITLTPSGNTLTISAAGGGGGSSDWADITNKPTTFTPTAHTHSTVEITSGIFDIERIPTGTSGTTVSLGNHLHTGVYEPVFTKNTAFNKNFGTAVGTVAQGNDSRINNGQTAFGWGNHSSAGYALNTSLTTHTGNTTVHITATERTNWNDANSKKHTHSNKALLDLITQSNIDVLEKLSVDVDGNIKVDTTLWATGGISALGLGEGGGGSGGGGADMLDAWANYTAGKENYYVPASLLVPFRDDTLGRLNSLESGSATSITTTGTGNAITSITKSGSVITATKGSTFSLSTHNHDTLYKPIGYAPTWGEVTGKPSTFTPSAHTHTIANVTNLQTALDNKQDTLTQGSNITITGSTISAVDTTYGVATTSVNGLMSSTDKVKLNGIATGANNYSHPASHPATIITEDASHRFVTDTEKSTWNAKSNLALGTTSTTAFRGDYGNAAYNHSQSAHDYLPLAGGTLTGNVTAPTFVGALSGNATSATNLSRSVVAGNGLTGGGALSADRTLTLGTPSTLTNATTNGVTTSSHTHAITTTTVGAANTIVATDASGGVRGNIIRIGGDWTLELSSTELVFKYQNVIKQRMLSDGTILATGGITALST